MCLKGPDQNLWYDFKTAVHRHSIQSHHELISKEKRAKLSVSKCSKLGEALNTCSRISRKTRFHKELTCVCRCVYVKHFQNHKCSFGRGGGGSPTFQ